MDSSDQPPFADVPTDSGRDRAVDLLHRRGIVIGYPYREELSREDAAKEVADADADTLLRRALKIPLGESWADFRLYFWISEYKLLFLRRLPRGKKGDFDLCYLDLRTNQQTTLTALTHRFNRYRGLRWEHSLSPDSQWLLWTDTDAKRITYTVASLDGKQQYSWSMDYEVDSLFWMPGRQAIVSLDDGMATLRDLHSLQTKQPFTFNPASDVMPDNLRGNGYVVSADRMLCASWSHREKEARQATVYETSLKRNPPVVTRRFTVLFPPGSFVQEVCFSPDGKYVAWVTILRQKGRTSVEVLWVSGSDGRGLREVGRVALAPNQNSDLSGFTWTPSGRHLSFVVRGSLWRVPIRER